MHEARPAFEMSGGVAQDGKPDFDLIEPRCVLGREVEDDAMVPLAQKRFAGCFEGKYSGLAFDPDDAATRPGPAPIATAYEYNDRDGGAPI
jgi:hypothetical protein